MDQKFTQFIESIREDRSLCRARATALTRILAPAPTAAQLRSRDIKLIPAQAEELVNRFEGLLFATDDTRPRANPFARQSGNLLIQGSDLRYAVLAMAEAYLAAGISAREFSIEESVQTEFMRRIASVSKPIGVPAEGWPTTISQLRVRIWEMMTAMKPGKKILDLVEPIMTAEWFMKQTRSIPPRQLLDYVKEQLTPNLQAAL